MVHKSAMLETAMMAEAAVMKAVVPPEATVLEPVMMPEPAMMKAVMPPNRTVLEAAVMAHATFLDLEPNLADLRNL